MHYPVYAPRINNNDDEVRLSSVRVSPGDAVRHGQELAEVETDKANFVVEAEREGFVLKVVPSTGDTIAVGSVLMWLGDTAADEVPGEAAAAKPAQAASAQPTAKARALISDLGLDAAVIPASGDRLTVQDVEAYVARQGAAPAAAAQQAQVHHEAQPAAAGSLQPMTMEERGMLRSVLWHRDHAAPAYLDVDYDHAAWERYAARMAEEKRLLSSPLLPLLAHRLVTLAASHPKLNSVVVDEQRFAYSHVNLGFTIQADAVLYLVVIPEAEALDFSQFSAAFNKLHRRAMTRRLTAAEMQGATIGFSSMSRWGVGRHIPILPPHVSFMLAHAVSAGGQGVLGATYDHRLLSGGDTISVLRELAKVPEE